MEGHLKLGKHEECSSTSFTLGNSWENQDYLIQISLFLIPLRSKNAYIFPLRPVFRGLSESCDPCANSPIA